MLEFSSPSNDQGHVAHSQRAQLRSTRLPGGCEGGGDKVPLPQGAQGGQGSHVDLAALERPRELGLMATSVTGKGWSKC